MPNTREIHLLHCFSPFATNKRPGRQFKEAVDRSAGGILVGNTCGYGRTKKPSWVNESATNTGLAYDPG